MSEKQNAKLGSGMYLEKLFGRKKKKTKYRYVLHSKQCWVV